MTDEELMARYVRGDQAAFRMLFARYSPSLLGVMRQVCRREEDALDLVQQTFLQLHRARHDFRVGAPLRPWLFTIAYNLRREYLRKTRRRREDLRKDPESGPEPSSVPRDRLEQQEDARRVRAALGQISASQAEVIELHWFGGLSFREISDVVGAGLSAVKVRAHRGYAALRKVLGEGGGNP